MSSNVLAVLLSFVLPKDLMSIPFIVLSKLLKKIYSTSHGQEEAQILAALQRRPPAK